MTKAHAPVEVFCFYAHEDELWWQKVEPHLEILKREGLISLWHERLITPGTDRARSIDRHLETASVILLLVSAAFLASDKCYSVELKRALERQKAGEARVVPILVRPVDWSGAPFAHLQPLPASREPLEIWNNQQTALTDITIGIRLMIKEMCLASASSPPPLSNVDKPFPNVSAVSSPLPHKLAEPSTIGRAQLNRSVSTTKAQPDLPAAMTTGVSRRAVLVATAGAFFTTGFFVGRLLFPQDRGVGLSSPTGTSQNQPVIYRAHSDKVDAVAWSPDGQQIASGSADRIVQVWNASDGSGVFTYAGHSEKVETVAWSPDGQRIASGSADRTVQVWKLSYGGNGIIYQGHTDKVNVVAWSLNGMYIASCSDDKTVQVWNANSGNTIITYPGHTDKVNAVAWSPDGVRIASCSDDKTVQVWNASSGNSLITCRGHSNAVNAVAWSPDGMHIASCSDDRTVVVWNVGDGSKVFTYRGHSGVVNMVAWSPQSGGKRIASDSQDMTVQVWNADDGNEVFSYRGHSDVVNALAWSPDGKRIASCSDDKTVQVWKVV